MSRLRRDHKRIYTCVHKLCQKVPDASNFFRHLDAMLFNFLEAQVNRCRYKGGAKSNLFMKIRPEVDAIFISNFNMTDV